MTEIIVHLIAVNKSLDDKIKELRERLIFKGTNCLPFKPNLDIRKCGKRFIVDIAIQCLEYLLDKKE